MKTNTTTTMVDDYDNDYDCRENGQCQYMTAAVVADVAVAAAAAAVGAAAAAAVDVAALLTFICGNA